MTKSDLFKKAHALAKVTVKDGDNYQATFALCLKAVYADSKGMQGTPKQVAWANTIKKESLPALSILVKNIDIALSTTTQGSVGHQSLTNIKSALVSIMDNNSAKFWIDNANPNGEEFETDERFVYQLTMACTIANPKTQVMIVVKILKKAGYL